MDAPQFLAEFGHIANAPGGVQCLREMIYNLAITGDLTRQFPDDGDAQTLLQDIELKRQRLIQSKQFKRTAKLESEPLRVPDNITLPTSWCWTRLLDIGEISPRNEAKDDDTAAFIPMSGISQLHNGGLVSEDRAWGEIKKGFTHFANGDVVIAKITPCFENGKAAVIAGLNNPLGIGAGTTELHVFRPIHPDVLPAYVYIFLRSPIFANEGERNMTGTAGQKRLPMEYFATRAMPLPPIAEQVRIVAKVDELMALCDKLESQQMERERQRYITGATVLESLSSAQSPAELLSAWSRLQTEANLLLVGG
jgi:type I restriction enzyme S subunit